MRREISNFALDLLITPPRICFVIRVTSSFHISRESREIP